MIVCPATKKVDKTTLLAEIPAWLPEGTYFDFFGGQVYRGGRKLKLYRELEHIAVLVPAGSIIPMAADYMHSHLENPEELELIIYNGGDGEFNLFEEKDGVRTLTKITHRWEGTRSILTIVPGERAGEVLPAHRSYTIRFRGFGPNLDGRPYDPETHETVVTVSAAGDQPVSLHLHWPSREIPETDRSRWIYERLNRAQMSYDLKDQLYHLITAPESLARKLAKLHALGLEESLLGALVECLTCDV